MEYDEVYANEQLRRSKHPLRRAIKHFYLNNVLRHVGGPSIDFGCGAGQLLRRMPTGSVGFELNPHLIRIHQAAGLDARLYDIDDELQFHMLQQGQYRTFVAAHVLEHFEDSEQALRSMLRSCKRLGIERVIIVVPGAKGYASDATHRTFVNLSYLRDRGLLACEDYAVSKSSFFPGNWEWLGKYYVFHELMIVYDLQAPVH